MGLFKYEMLIKKANKLLDDINELLEKTDIEEKKISKLAENNKKNLENIDNTNVNKKKSNYIII